MNGFFPFSQQPSRDINKLPCFIFVPLLHFRQGGISANSLPGSRMANVIFLDFILNWFEDL